MTALFDFSDDVVQDMARSDVVRALAEDVGTGDLTAALVPADRLVRARVLAREPAVLCGSPWVEAAVAMLDPQARLMWHVQEGKTCEPHQVVLEMQGQARALLTVERTALNFMQLLSGVASKTARYVAAIQGTRARIVDTRKTLPGLRMAQKYAVKAGGGFNHRMGLFDAVLIKENHITAAGGISAVLSQVASVAAQASFVEIEVETLSQLQEALAAGATMVLLDNMDLKTLQEAVCINESMAASHGRAPAILEISGGVTLEQVQTLAQTGVDRISIGALTKDVKAIDFSMRFEGL